MLQGWPYLQSTPITMTSRSEVKQGSTYILKHCHQPLLIQVNFYFFNTALAQLGSVLDFAFVPEKSVTQNCTSVTVLIKLNISINSRPIDFKFCMVPNLTKLNEPKYEKPNQTNPNQTKPNQTIFHLNAKYSLISYAIFIKFCMVISITLWYMVFKTSLYCCYKSTK